MTNGSPKTVVIYLVGGPAGEPYLLPGATLSFLGKMFPDSLIIVPAYFGTRERMPLRFADSVELAQHEITELVNDIGRVFPGKSIFLVGESFGSYVAGGVSGANGTLYLSPPVTSPSEILRRTVSAAPEKTKTDKVLVSFFNQTQPRAPPRRLIRRWDILNGMLKSQRVIGFDIGNVLRRERCSLAILGRNDHLVKGIDIAPSQNINRKIFWIEGDNHKLPSITDESNLWIVQQLQRRWNQQCFSGDDERNEKH